MKNETLADVDGFTLAGNLLGYPECCIEHFSKGLVYDNEPLNYEGYRPCNSCAKLSREELMAKIGRDTRKEPEEFNELLRGAITYNRGLKIYQKYGKSELFKRAWAESRG